MHTKNIKTRHEIESEIINNNYNDIDFYAYCITPWHALGVRAYIDSIRAENIKRGIVLISHNPNTNYLINENDFTFESNIEVEYFYCKESKRNNKFSYLLKLLKKNHTELNKDQKVLRIIRPFRPDVKFGLEYQKYTKNRCEIVCIDEGLGTYKSDFEIFKEKARGSIKLGMSYLLVNLLYKLLATTNKVSPTYFTLFTKKNGNLELNTKTVDIYKNCLTNYDQDKINFGEKYVIILTQPFEIKQDIKSKVKINHLYAKIKEIFENNNYKVFIKPHPREGIEIINEYKNKRFNIIESKLAFETFMESLKYKPNFVIGSLSTSLVTASILGDITSISIAKMDRFNINYRRSVKKFVKRYKNYVNFPSNVYELIETLEN